VLRTAKSSQCRDGDFRLVSLKSIAELVDAHRSSVCRWLDEEGMRPIVMGRGRNSAIRYRWSDIKRWLEQREEIDWGLRGRATQPRPPGYEPIRPTHPKFFQTHKLR
jgi:hypothetical protein